MYDTVGLVEVQPDERPGQTAAGTKQAVSTLLRRSTVVYRRCRGCGAANPEPNHSCEPQCLLCKKAHLLGDNKFREIYRMPYIIKKSYGRRLNKRNSRRKPRLKARPRPPHRHLQSSTEAEQGMPPETSWGNSQERDLVRDPEGGLVRGPEGATCRL
ncbi:hypothetical protein HPB49_011549 [Dermacentor silvarum]|uniref:Uncharacterized protein n=1 Tax=Dermacentor silvarum TaxID=543639 RepID=A0ACB8C384_DERSI|nr:hypothetical protein HPB49_011549 [Dermacentor silvarum]